MSTTTALLLGLLPLAVIVAAVHIANVVSRRSASECVEPRPCTHADPRCIAVERKLAEARDSMRKRGIATLLGDRPAWTRVTGGQVVSIRRA